MTNYKKMMQFVQNGDTQNSSLNELSESYSKQYNESISMFDVIINSDRADVIYKDGKEYRAIIDYGTPMKKNELGNLNFRTLREIRTRHEDKITSGSIIKFEKKHSKELSKFLLYKTIETKEGYDLSAMDECNYVLKWQKDNEFIECDSIVFSRTAYKDDVYNEKIMTLATGQYEVYVPVNEDTKKLKIDERFFIGRDVYKISHVDEITLKNVLMLTMNKDQYNKDTDNYELGIADYKEIKKEKPSPIDPQPNTIQVLINGNSSARINQSLTYEAKILENGMEINDTVNWLLSNGNAQIINKNNNTCTIKGTVMNTVVELIAEWNGYEVRKEIEIKGLW